MENAEFERYQKEREFFQKQYDFDKEIEATKVWVDYLKHIATLSTGSLVLIATFLEKLFSKPVWKAAIVTALIGFVVAIIASLISMSALALRSEDWKFKTNEFHTEALQFIAMIVCWCGFAMGIIGLTCFTIRNLY